MSFIRLFLHKMYNRVFYIFVFAGILGGPCTDGSLAKFKSAKCTVLDPATITLNYCFVKAFSRADSFLNIGVTLSRKLDRPCFVK